MGLNLRILISILVISFFSISCAPRRGESTLITYGYDKKKNQTNYAIIPYGSVSVLGEWKRENYNAISKQQFFTNSDSIILTIAFSPCNKFEFNMDNSKTGFDFISSFYEWESNYFVNEHGLKSNIVEKDETNNFIVWRIHGDNENDGFDTYFLTGENNCRVSNFSISKTNKWSKQEKIVFLKNLFLKNE